MRAWLKKIDPMLVGLGLKRPAVPLTAEERTFLEAIFVPQHYARMTGLSGYDNTELLNHFMRFGLRLNLSPTPLFDRQTFLEQAGPSQSADLPDVIRWFRAQRDIVPIRHFNPEVYRGLYPDVAEPECSPYEHFLLHGVREGRQPNGLFDAKWYDAVVDRRQGEIGLPPYIHFLLYGVQRGISPSAGLLSVFRRTSTAAADPAETYARAERAVRPWIARLGAERARTVLFLFNPDTYDGNGECPADSGGLQRLEHFLDRGLVAGIDPGPLFDGALYAKRVNIADTDQINPLLHFLEYGMKNRVVPTSLFDDAIYADAWPDMRGPEIWGFLHFIEHGIFEGRRIDGSERTGAWSLPPDSAGGQFHNWELFWREAGFTKDDDLASGPVVSSRQDSAGGWAAGGREEDLPLVRALFVPRYYATVAGLDPSAPTESLLDHFLQYGLDQDLPPGPLFDPALARALTGETSGPALLAWLRKRRPNWRAPTEFFDKTFYQSYYRDFAGVDFDLFEHFVLHGLGENRMPTFAFDPAWYMQSYKRFEAESGYPAYLHYLLFGAARGLAPSRLLMATFDVEGDGSSPGLDNYLAICRAGASWVAQLDADKMLAMMAMFSPYTYDGEGALPETASGTKRLVDFLDRGIRKGLAPSPLFEPELYEKNVFGADDPPLLHYLRRGWPKKQVATRLFSEEAYQAAHADIRSHGIWGFRHFLLHGVYEGRKVDECARLTLFPKVDDLAGRELNNLRIFWASTGVPSEKIGLPSGVGRTQQRLNEIVASPVLTEIVRRAVALDPVIGNFRKGDAYHAPPFHDRAYPAILKLQDRIPGKHYGTIITVPWLRVGGADLVACQLAEAVRFARPDENVLILRVDRPNFDRPDWVPSGVDVAYISDILSEVPEDVAERLIFTLMKILEPKRLINVNSNRVWRTLERFGRRLRPHVNLYSYLFCWDQTPDGIRVGYPSMFYASTAPNLTGLFTDTIYLRDELARMYRPSQEIGQRTYALFTPARSIPPRLPLAKVSTESLASRRPRVLWAGRLDRQKRFDLVQHIAWQMPHVDFLCWGDAVLDFPPDMTQSPSNLLLQPSFSSYDELPLDSADLWLFTSAWEGMPTILIEIAIRGVCVVASAVGGVPELIDDTTGYPVVDADSTETYVRIISQALDDPKQRVQRARRLQNRAKDRYSQTRYVRDLDMIFGKEA
ncbi:glycosyltransferase family 4 protein [Sphingomonas sp. GlSt437]|uniref:glycosyltransferase family 4 protein n=1 Tax=Sphingomonas sp. GlSt437 TaxID=3389970 RepID=UPI003A875EF4